MRAFIFTKRERRLLTRWLETGSEDGETLRTLIWVRQRSPRLAEDVELMLKVVAYMAQVVEGIAKGFDERQIDKSWDELERTVPYHPHHGEACQQREYTPVDCHTQIFDHGEA